MAVGAVAAAAACTPSTTPSLHAISGVAQGTTYSLQWAGGASEREVAAAAEEELARIDQLLSNYRADSTLEQFNAALSTDPIELPSELVALLELAKRIHGASEGCFDPTVRPLVRAWGFDGDSPAVPTTAAIDAARASVGLDKLEIVDATHARKTVARLEIDMASIGRVTDQQRQTFFDAGRRLHARGAEAVMLGGTDLFLAFAGREPPFPLVDCADMHVDAIFARSSSR